MRLKLIAVTFLTASLLTSCSGVQDSHSSSGGGSSQVTVTVTPKQVSVVVNQTEAFQATVTGSTNTSVTWQVNSWELQAGTRPTQRGKT